MKWFLLMLDLSVLPPVFFHLAELRYLLCMLCISASLTLYLWDLDHMWFGLLSGQKQIFRSLEIKVLENSLQGEVFQKSLLHCLHEIVGLFRLFDALFCAWGLFVQMYLQKQQEIKHKQNQYSASLNLSSRTSHMCPDKCTWLFQHIEEKRLWTASNKKALKELCQTSEFVTG